MFITFHAIIVESRTLWVWNCQHENNFWHEIATQVHSRSFILQSFTGRQGVAYRYVTVLALFLKFPKK